MFLTATMKEKYLKWSFIIVIVNVFFREKFSRLTMGFGYFMYSHSLVPVIDPWGSGRDKVGIRAMVSLLIFKLSFCVFLHYCGIRLSNIGSVFIASSILSCVYFMVMLWFYLVCLLRMRSGAWDAHAAEAVDNVEQSFQDDAIAPAPTRRTERDSSGRGVLSQVVFAYS